MEMDKTDNNELNTEIIPEIKRVTLHPLTAEGETDLEVNLYPKTLLDGIVDREGKPVEVQEKLISGENIIIESNTISAIVEDLLETTWAELKALRDNSHLIPGRFYRITDYECTTADADTQSAGHVFDIIVRADSTNKLNDEASAIKHDGDTYFADNNLEAWKLWYCLDNDANRFGWADSAAGKGVIYRMIDEFGNDCPYDFKNILFTYLNKYENAYTFSYTENGVIKDASILGKDNDCYNNTMKERIIEGGRQVLNSNVFYSSSSSFACFSNTFWDNCYANTLGNCCSSNIFGEFCSDNTFGNDCYANAIGKFFVANTFGNNCSRNTFGNDFFLNTFGNYCSRNTFGNGCANSVFGNSCSSNTFGNGCGSNIFGNDCYTNTFGDGCFHIVFGTRSGSTNTPANYYQHNIIDNGCSYLCLKASGTASYNSQAQNIHVHLGVAGTSYVYKAITVDRNLPYETNIVAAGTTTIEV